MFGRGTEQLLEALPYLTELDDRRLRRLLTAAWLDAADRRDLGGDGLGSAAVDAALLRRLATALEIHALLAPEAAAETVRACAFVAAEALAVARETVNVGNEFDTPDHPECLEAALLYLIAGYDANAAVTVRGLSLPESLSSAERHARETIAALMRLGAPVDAPPEEFDDDAALATRVRAALWRRMADLVTQHIRWLRELGSPDPDAAEALRALAAEL